METKGFPMQMEMSAKLLTSYLARCERAGLNRLERTKLPSDMLRIDPDQRAAAKAAAG